jgi:hypothetical protein
MGCYIMHIQVDHAEPKAKIQAEQVQWVFGDPQASSCEDANIVLIKASLSGSNQCSLSFIFNLCFMFYFECALSYRSCMAL